MQKNQLIKYRSISVAKLASKRHQLNNRSSHTRNINKSSSDWLCEFRRKNISGFISEFLLVGFSDKNNAGCLVTVDPMVQNGKKLF